ncbi:RNA polymerase factor sigma-54 [Ligilactobacillus equi]|uniref:RNA polymerase factor sigma-54 n=1 Tax=Ligilactobacillus equi TaxID=137357 RepID=UPI002ED24820
MQYENRLNQKQTQIQKLVLSQNMQRSLHVLRISNEELRNYVKEEALANPLMTVSYRQKSQGFDEPVRQEVYQDQGSQSLYEYLLEQINLTMRATPLRQKVLYLADNLDDNGYLQLDFAQLSQEDELAWLDALTLLQELDPPGIGARDLQECLLLQINRDEQAHFLAAEVLKADFAAFVQKDWTYLASQYACRVSDLEDLLAYVQTLTPAPGAAYKQEEIEYTYPDMIVKSEAGKLALQLTRYAQPEIILNERYLADLVGKDDQEVAAYLQTQKEKLQELAQAIAMRGQTLKRIGQEIISYQQDFFLKAEHPLKPWLLRDLAQKLQLHESTISRAVNGKYLQTDFGSFELRSFFTQATVYHNVNGQDVQVDKVKAEILRLIENEDKRKPLSDQKIVLALDAQGVKISRRTVAKYRETAGIAGSSKRKES